MAGSYVVGFYYSEKTGLDPVFSLRGTYIPISYKHFFLFC